MMFASIIACFMSAFFAGMAGLGIYATVIRFTQDPPEKTAVGLLLIGVFGTISWVFAYAGGW